MSQVAQKTEEFDCTPEEFFSLISDYESYGDFLSEVDRCQVVDEVPGKKLVEYQVKLIKKFRYRLWMVEKPGESIHWSFDSGDLFKSSDGSWVLEPLDGGTRTKATYSVEAKFKLFVPGKITKALASVNLPNMMSAYKKRVKEMKSSS